MPLDEALDAFGSTPATVPEYTYWSHARARDYLLLYSTCPGVRVKSFSSEHTAAHTRSHVCRGQLASRVATTDSWIWWQYGPKI
jgi:hypothetical protein